MKRRTIVLISLLLALAMLLSACSTAKQPAADTPPDDASGQTAEQPPEKPAEKVTLKMIDSLANEARTAAIQKNIDDFMAENPNITVELISPPTDGADAKIQQMLLAGEQLDLIDTGNSFQACVNNGWVQPLNDWLADWEGLDTLTAEAYSRAISFSREDEVMYLLPYGIYSKLVFYRADWFKEAGLETPTTWEDLYEAGLKLTDPSQNRYGWGFRGGARGYAYYDMLLISYLGSDKVTKDDAYSYFLEDGTSIYRTPEALEALEFYKKLYTDISPTDSIAWGFTEMVQGFMGGTVAMLLQDNDVIASCEDGMDPDTWGVFPLPLGPSGQGSSPLGYGGWGMTSYTEHPEETIALLKYISSPAANGYFCEQTGLNPIHITTYEESDKFSTGAYTVFGEMGAMEGKYVYAGGGGGKYDCAATFNTDRDEYLQKYLMGEVSGEELLDYWASTWEAAYQAQGKLW